MSKLPRRVELVQGRGKAEIPLRALSAGLHLCHAITAGVHNDGPLSFFSYFLYLAKIYYNSSFLWMKLKCLLFFNVKRPVEAQGYKRMVVNGTSSEFDSHSKKVNISYFHFSRQIVILEWRLQCRASAWPWIPPLNM